MSRDKELRTGIKTRIFKQGKLRIKVLNIFNWYVNLS